jgi:hypothetical protein
VIQNVPEKIEIKKEGVCNKCGDQGEIDLGTHRIILVNCPDCNNYNHKNKKK